MDTHTHRTTTVTLAAHACRGLTTKENEKMRYVKQNTPVKCPTKRKDDTQHRVTITNLLSKRMWPLLVSGRRQC